MKYLSVPILVLLLLLSCVTIFGTQLSTQTAPLTLTVEILDQHYCRINAETSSLQMRLRLRYKNVSNQKLILYKGHDLFYQTKIRSLSGEGAGLPYEVTFLNSRFFDEEIEPIEQPSPSRVFVILPPNAAYERELMVNVPVVDDGAQRGNHAIRAGEHSLLLIISTWYKSRPLAQKLRQQWERKGSLWFDPVISTPISFTVQKPDTQTPCGKATH
jgi:hypothetical protein